MKKLILFDIDRTLIHGPDNEKYIQSISNLHDLNLEVTLDVHGLTDKLILTALLEEEGWSDEQIKRALPELLQEVAKVYGASFQKGSVKVLPGVPELLTALKARNINLGLITGNVEDVAKRKLEDGNLWKYFSVGGFGSDVHTARTDLINLAIDKAGFGDSRDQVYVVGDTPRDILAAQQAGITHTVAVSNGFRPLQELIDAKAEIVLEDFRDTQAVLSQLKIG